MVRISFSGILPKRSTHCPQLQGLFYFLFGASGRNDLTEFYPVPRKNKSIHDGKAWFA